MKYLLTFKPLKSFFFGNDRTFSVDYVAASEYFPQNTQLLGAIRLFIAEQNQLMHVHKNGKYSNDPNELKKLVGTASAKDFDTNDNLGKIQSLSQMFILNRSLDDAYFPTPMDVKIEFDHHGTQIIGDDGKIHLVNYPQKAKLTYYELAKIDENYFLKNYDVKNNSSQMLGNRNFWNFYLKKEPRSINGLQQYNDVFIPHTQVGIGLENKKTIEGAFYSKTDYQLSESFLFGCLIELEERIINDGIIQIGAEGSLFELHVMPFADTKLQDHPIVSRLFQTPEPNEKLVCISDTMLTHTDELDAYFTIAPYYKNFAMLDNDYARHKGKTAQKRLIPAGTVAYIKNKMPKQPQGAYAKMGFNQFITTTN
jgi:CRISPR type III-B/RAMP module-associated protein Cmr3